LDNEEEEEEKGRRISITQENEFQHFLGGESTDQAVLKNKQIWDSANHLSGVRI